MPIQLLLLFTFTVFIGIFSQPPKSRIRKNTHTQRPVCNNHCEISEWCAHVWFHSFLILYCMCAINIMINRIIPPNVNAYCAQVFVAFSVRAVMWTTERIVRKSEKPLMVLNNSSFFFARYLKFLQVSLVINFLNHFVWFIFLWIRCIVIYLYTLNKSIAFNSFAGNRWISI